MSRSPTFDHEKLDVYQLAVEFARWVGEVLDGPLASCTAKSLVEMPEDTLPKQHRARVLWAVTGELDLSGFTRDAKAVDGRAGRPAYSPRMLLTLWLYAISCGVGSAREIARLTETELAYRWISGEMRVSHQLLSRFRVSHGEVLDGLMTQVLGTLLHKGLLSLQVVAQDGTRGQQAIATVKQLRPSGKGKARASTTDPEARVMKMPDGGYRPGYNVQLAVAGSPMGGPRTIVGLRVTNIGSDMSSLTPMLEDIERRTAAAPAQLLADANHTAHDDIRAVAARGVELLAPVPQRSRNCHAAHDEVIKRWAARMRTTEAKRATRARASLCELANAHLKDRFGLRQLLVRSTAKVTCVALLGCLAFNMLQHASSLLG